MKFLQSLTPVTKKYTIWVGLGALIITFCVFVQNSRFNKLKATPPNTPAKIDMLEYNDNAFEESMDVILNKTEASIASLKKEIEEVKRSMDHIDSLNKEIEILNNEKAVDPHSTNYPLNVKDDNKMLSSIDQAEAFRQLQALANQISSEKDPKIPDVKMPVPSSESYNPHPDVESGIDIFHVAPPKENSEEDEYDIKTLTSGSWMEASLLTGVITSMGNNQPVPMLIRINDLAVLPNKIKEDLKGCFVVANGTGALDQERILSRTVSLSCVTKNGEAIIDEEIKGWVADQDSRPGLLAKPVARFGAALARVAVADFLKGVGGAINQSSLVMERDSLGERTQFKDTEMDTIFKSGAGQSVQGVADTLHSFYLDLAKSTLPVLEVGPTKRIFVVLSHGVDLKIKSRRRDDEKKDG